MAKLSSVFLSVSLWALMSLQVSAQLEEMVKTHPVQESIVFYSGTSDISYFSLPVFDHSLGNLTRVKFSLVETGSVYGAGQPFTDPVFDGPNGYIAGDVVHWTYDLSNFGGGFLQSVDWLHHIVCGNDEGCSFDQQILDFPNWFTSDTFGPEIPASEYPSGEAGTARLVGFHFESVRDEYSGSINVATTIDITGKLEYFYYQEECPIGPISPVQGDALTFEGPPPNTPQASKYSPQVESVLDDGMYSITALPFVNGRNSGYRPPAYQTHFRELRNLTAEYLNLGAADKEKCSDLKSELDHEIDTRHGIARAANGIPKVARPTASAHTVNPAFAVDAGSTNFSAEQFELMEIAGQQPGVGIHRPCGKGDPVHFTLQSTGCEYSVSGEVESPVNLLITDPLGRKIGFDPATGSEVNDFGEFGYYSGADSDPHVIFIDDTVPGTYTMTGIGTGDGPYTATLKLLTEHASVRYEKIISGDVTPGSTISLETMLPVYARIDIDPFEENDVINWSDGIVPVTILTTDSFDPITEVDRSTLTFGGTGTENSLVSCFDDEDQNSDNVPDLLCHFRARDTELTQEDTQGTLLGQIGDGFQIEGIAYVKVVGKPSPTELKLQELYIGILGRSADRPGLDYWLHEIYSGGLTLENTRASFTHPDQAEYTEIYGGLDNTQLVTATYENFLERAPEAAGLLYWVEELDNGRVNPDQMINAVINAVRDPDATSDESVKDLAVLENKIAAAKYFTEQTRDYPFDIAYREMARTVVANVTSDPETVMQAKAMIDEYVGN